MTPPGILVEGAGLGSRTLSDDSGAAKKHHLQIKFQLASLGPSQSGPVARVGAFVTTGTS